MKYVRFLLQCENILKSSEVKTVFVSKFSFMSGFSNCFACGIKRSAALATECYFLLRLIYQQVPNTRGDVILLSDTPGALRNTLKEVDTYRDGLGSFF